MLAKIHERDYNLNSDKSSAPHYNVVLVDPRAQWLVGQDPTVSYDDASFTAPAATLK